MPLSAVFAGRLSWRTPPKSKILQRRRPKRLEAEAFRSKVPLLRLGCPSFEKSMRPQTQYDASSTECAISRRTHQQPIAAIPPSGASAVGTAPSAAPRGGAPCLLVRADASGGQKKHQQHFELLCGSERLRRLYGRGRWAYLRCGVRGKARRGFQTGVAAERSACGRTHKGRSHGLLPARLVYQVQREGARGASGGRRPQLGGAGVLRGQVVTYPLRTPESQAEDLAATVVAKAAAVLHCRMLARP